MDRLLNILRRDVNTLLGFWIWRIVTIALLIFGGIAFIFAAIIGGIFFNVSASTISTWFAFTLITMLLLSLLTATIIFTIWFMRQNIWIAPLVIVLLLVITVCSYSGKAYVIDCTVCGEKVCFDDPSELENLACAGKCPDCNNYELTYGLDHTKRCGTRIDTSCPTCGVENSYVQDLDLNHLYCNKCDKDYDMECAICGTVDSIIEVPGSDVLYCSGCDNEFELECSECEKTTHITKDTDVNDLRCEECDKNYVRCSNCSNLNRNSEIITEYGIKPLRCTECNSINNNVEMVEEGGMDVIKQFRLRKFIKFIDYKFDDLINSIKNIFK